MTRKLFGLTSMVLALSMLVGCAGGGVGSTPASSAQESSTAAASSGTSSVSSETAPADTAAAVELTMWTGTWNETKMPELLKKFQESNPNITVKFEYFPWDGMEDKYMTAMQANATPDVLDMAIAWTIPYGKMGKLRAVDEYASKSGLNLEDTFYPGGLETLTTDGKHYALPYRTEVLTLIYNKELFEQAGLDPEVPPKTWDEVAAFGKKLAANNVYGFGLCGNGAGNTANQVLTMMFEKGVEVLSPDESKAAFNTPAAVEALQTWSNLHLVEKIVPTSVLENDNTINRNLFAEGKLAMYMSGSYDLTAIYEANPNIKMGFGMIPTFSDGNRKVQQGGWNIGITSTCPDANAEAAFQWISFLASPEISVTFSDTISACKASAGDPKYADPDMKLFIEMLPFGKPLPGNVYMTEITNIIYSEAQAVLSGVKDAATALKAAEARTNELLAG